MHLILFVGKSWHGQIQVTVGLLCREKNWSLRMGGGIELGKGGKEMWPPVGIWEPLLRFIGVGILWTWGIIHGKASLSGPVYKMRQGWQRWRPSTTEPSCLNMGLRHLTYPWHQLQPFGIKIQLKIDAAPYNTKHYCQFLSPFQWHVCSVIWKRERQPCKKTFLTMHLFLSQNATNVYTLS